MLAPSSDLLRAGIGLKLNQIKLATRSYLRDRTNQASGTITSYAVATGLLGAAGVFLIAACLVGATALFRWIEIHHGQFWAFGAIGALLLAIAAICAGLAAAKLRQPSPHFPSLTSRLRVAIKANPLQPDQIEAARDTAASVLLAAMNSTASFSAATKLAASFGLSARNRSVVNAMMVVTWPNSSTELKTL